MIKKSSHYFKKLSINSSVFIFKYLEQNVSLLQKSRQIAYDKVVQIYKYNMIQ